ncbi:cytochrome c biogenesis protein ResB [Sediminitomix flava]|uniref:Respiratory nitrite reductase-specific cytochrome c biogenesis protein NrfK /respiratory nitrite reductase-specific cytochrome c biogenesis protein NrfL n=1 Tax=Sediminitomix flava TaxID=379075 RepID=A0A315ZE89_SEDFL|nr:cytochrome c biogenesis protein ResB [Sediminitomix flava]PWJ43054.1 respiratory nitrite reductase-specific cytochrome c biogenesis protein NrfK /respiratory nitrite reductase-specific cytochrome c biogenesis protein NrfL [Sediminitomix flava]
MNAVKNRLGEDQIRKEKVVKPLWAFPWEYRESFLIAFGLVVTGLLLQISIGKEVEAFKYPFNVILMGGFAVLTILIHILFKTNPIIKWLRSVPASISSIVALLVLVSIMGTIPQANFTQGVEKDIFGFSHMTTSWTFLITMLFFLTTLGFTTVNRIFPFRFKNVGFILNHLGLWIAVVAGTMGAGDLQRLSMDLYEGQPEWRAYNEKGQIVEMPIAFKLNNFLMEEFTPKLAIVNNEEGKLVEGQNSMVIIEKGNQYEHAGWEIKVEDYLYESVRVSVGNYQPVNEEGAAPAAKVSVTNLSTGEKVEGWVSCGSFRRQYEAMRLNNDFSLVMTTPEPKKYASDVTVFTHEGTQSEERIEVNYPLEVDGWNVYQLSYDSNYGRWSKLSVVELVRDPWLPVVYIGIFMMLFGAVEIMWTGYQEKK